jgi:hypothetical protein
MAKRWKPKAPPKPPRRVRKTKCDKCKRPPAYVFGEGKDGSLRALCQQHFDRERDEALTELDQQQRRRRRRK